MNRSRQSLIPWFFVMLLALAAAYYASLPRQEKIEQRRPILTLDQSKIAVIRMTAKDLKVEAIKKTAERWWISYERSHPDGSAQTANLATPQTAAQKPVEKWSAESFLASSKFKDITAALAPFTAIRVIGTIDEKQRAEFGFTGDMKSFEVSAVDGAKLLALDVGKSLYGSRNVYVLNRQDQNVYLVSGDWLADFEKPELRFYERALTSIPSEEIQAAVVSHSGKERRFTHTKREATGDLIWTPEDNQDAAVGVAGIWFAKFEQLKAALYATEEREKDLAAQPVLFEVDLTGLGAVADKIQIRKVVHAGQVEYWATSAFLGGHVKVASTRAESLEREIGRLVGP
jgi:hypothetical protein